VWHSKRTFCWIYFACSFLTKLFEIHSSCALFEQFNVTFYWFLTSSLQYLVLEFVDTWPWMSFLTYILCTILGISELPLVVPWLILCYIFSSMLVKRTPLRSSSYRPDCKRLLYSVNFPCSVSYAYILNISKR
jgi:hypothetical protein